MYYDWEIQVFPRTFPNPKYFHYRKKNKTIPIFLERMRSSAYILFLSSFLSIYKSYRMVLIHIMPKSTSKLLQNKINVILI